MSEMNPRHRLLTAISHREPDRVPLDLGAAAFSSITEGAYRPLMAHLGLSIQEPLEVRKSSGVVRRPGESLLRQLSIDTRGVWGPNDPDHSRDHNLPDGDWVDEWGVRRHKATGSPTFDLVQPPLPGDITVHDIDRFPWPDPHDPGRLRGLRAQAEAIAAEGRHALVANFTTTPVHFAQFLRGFEDWYVDFVANPAVARALHERLTDWILTAVGDLIAEIGPFVDIWAFADDIGGQNGPLVAPKHYRQIIKPQHARIIAAMKAARPGVPVMFHSCGSVKWAIDDLIDIGVDILNPVQVSAGGMDTRELKQRWGDQLTFWGGIDTQQVLPFGTPAQVVDEVRRRIDDLAQGGGFVLAAVHNIQPEVPPENIVAAFQAAVEYGGYSKQN